MGKVLLLRLIQAIFTLLAVSVVLFVLTRTTGDPVDALLPLNARPEDRERLRKFYGLDRPLYVQYWKFIKGAVRGEFGDSLRTQQPAINQVKDRIANTILLSTGSVLFGVLLSIPLGILAAIHRRGLWDRVAMTVALLGQSIPAFFTAVLAVYIFGAKLDLLPINGIEGWKSYVLPCITLGWVIASGMTRLLRSSMLEVLDSEFVKLARAKGLSEWTVILKHAFRNALIPLATFIAYTWGALMGAAIAVEVVFGWPGLGRLALEATLFRDSPLLQAVVLTMAVLIIFGNFVVDILYGLFDPRIRA